MSNQDNSWPAFPYQIVRETTVTGAPLKTTVFTGMTLRDYFAAKAMTALIAKIPLHDRQGEHGIHTPEVSDIQQVRLDVAQSAFDYADAMIAERAKARPQ